MSKAKDEPKPRNEIVENVLSVFGGLHTIAELCHISISAVCQWRETVPTRHQQTLLEYARDNGIDFTPADFFSVRRFDTGVLPRRVPKVHSVREAATE